jgi:2-(1,2-epoxy-1,2-dihydrophenyl)acetyl-CoA isomerase
MSSFVIHEKQGDVAVIRMKDEKTLNAASLAMAAELLDAFGRAARESRAIVFTGEGRGFCSGANLFGLDPQAPDYDAGAPLASHFNPMMRMLRNLPIPLVTAVNGVAAGIGCALALAGDMILASDRAYFLQAFRHVALVPDGASAFLLTRAIGRVRAMEMMLMGERIPAAKALEWGLINRVVPHEGLQDAALAVASELAAGPVMALAMIRKMCWDSLETGFEDQLAADREMQRVAGTTADHREGFAAFIEKRSARFTGRPS